MHNNRYFYKYTSAETAMTILRTRFLRWSSPKLFNDPFDITQELRLDFDPQELNRLFADQWASHIIEGNASAVGHPTFSALGTILDRLPPEERRGFASRLMHGEWPEPRLESFSALKEFWTALVPRLRVLCLCSECDITPMWNHYADRYAGVVLEFECVEEIDSCFLVAEPVRYQDEPPRIASPHEWVKGLLDGTNDAFLRMMHEYQFTKTLAWSYEREWRIVTHAKENESGLYTDFAFDPRELSSIVFGSQCSNSTRDEIRTLLGGDLKHVKCYEAIAEGNAGRFNFMPVGT